MSSGSDQPLLLIQRTLTVGIDSTQYATQKDLLLTQDSVYLIQQPGFDQLLQQYQTIYGLKADAQARGINLSSRVKWLDYEQWVELTLTAKQVIRI